MYVVFKHPIFTYFPWEVCMDFSVFDEDIETMLGKFVQKLLPRPGRDRKKGRAKPEQEKRLGMEDWPVARAIPSPKSKAISTRAQSAHPRPKRTSARHYIPNTLNHKGSLGKRSGKGGWKS